MSAPAKGAKDAGAAPTVGEPLSLTDFRVRKKWVNALGHMRAAEYVCRFDEAFMALFTRAGLTDEKLLHGKLSPFLMDLHACYLRELRERDAVTVAGHALEVDEKRCRIFLTMFLEPEAKLAATCELLIVNMDLGTRRPAPWSVKQGVIWTRMLAAHASLPRPPQAGRGIPAFSTS